MERTVKETPNEIPGWFRLLLATFCLAAFVCGARFVPSTSNSSKTGNLNKTVNLDETGGDAEFSTEAPARYLSSSLAFEGVDSYLDGRGRRFEYDPSKVDAVLVRASRNVNETIWEKSTESGELTSNFASNFASIEPQGADFVDDFNDDFEDDFEDDFNAENEELVADLSNSREAPKEPEEGVSSFADLASPDLPTDRWKEDELNCEFEDLSRQWTSAKDAKPSDEFVYDGADFDEEFDRSLVTDDLFHTGSTTAFVGQTNATSGVIAQVSAETPAQPTRSGRYIPQGAVGGSGDVVVQVK